VKKFIYTASIPPVVWVVGAILNQILSLRRLRVSVLPDRMEYIQGRKITVFLWHEIEAVYLIQKDINMAYDRAPFYVIEYEVHRIGDEKVSLHYRLTRGTNLGHTIEREVTKHLLPRLIKRFHEGESVGFGKIVINQQGLRLGTKTFPWREVQEVGYKIEIGSRDRWVIWLSTRDGKRIDVGSTYDTPNVFLLPKIVNHITALYHA
jgi:uncharacterized protein DUF6585